jgi:hypothetical protein
VSQRRFVVRLLIIVLVAAAMYGIIRSKREMVDFNVYRIAGARALNAEPLFRADDGHYQFKYLPAFALAAAPLAWVPSEVGKAIWFAISVWLLFVFFRNAVHGLPDRRLTAKALYWCSGLLMGKFIVRELVHGQTNVLLGVIAILSLIALQNRRYAAGGALAGLAIFVKPYALVLAPWLIVAGGMTAVLACAAVLIAGLILPAAVYGWTGNMNELYGWYRTVTDTTAPNLLVPENVSLATMWAKWLEPGPTAAMLAVVSGLVLLLLPLAAVLWRRRVEQPSYLEFGMLMVLIPLLSPQGWDYVLLLATPAVVCLVDRLRDTPRAWQVLTAAALITMGFTIFDLVGRTIYVAAMKISIISVCAIIMMIALTELRRRAIA